MGLSSGFTHVGNIVIFADHLQWKKETNFSTFDPAPYYDKELTDGSNCSPTNGVDKVKWDPFNAYLWQCEIMQESKDGPKFYDLEFYNRASGALR